MRCLKLSLTLLAAMVALGACVASSSANHLSISSQTWRVVFSDPPAEFPFVACGATLEGSFHSRTIAKVRGALIGVITRAQFHEEACTRGTGRFLTERLPWHLRYEAFQGTLPAISSVSIAVVGMEILWTQGFLRCLVRTTAEEPAKAILSRESGGKLTSFRWDETVTIFGTGICEGHEDSVAGTTGITVQNSTAAITVTLI